MNIFNAENNPYFGENQSIGLYTTGLNIFIARKDDLIYNI